MSLREQTVVIAVIGVTGSGKSTFIDLASGSSSPASNSPRSCTTELELSTFSLDGRTVTLIDTPGFHDTAPSVLDVLKLISDHFSGLYSQGFKLAGVIYMHYITEDRMDGLSRDNFRVFRKFCGDTSLRDVLIVANKGPDQGLYDGEVRAQESLQKDELFKPAVDKGARIHCHDGSQASAYAILRNLINREHTIPPTQEDPCGLKPDLARTTTITSITTGADAARELAGQVEHHAKAFGELCQGIDAATRAQDKETKEALQEKAKNSLGEIERIRYDLEQMVTDLATENLRLEDENRRYKREVSVQRVETQHNVRPLGEDRRVCELAEVGRGRAESQLAEERRQKIEDGRREQTRPTLQYDKLFVCGTLVFALICVSRFAFDSFTFSLL